MKISSIISLPLCDLCERSMYQMGDCLWHMTLTVDWPLWQLCVLIRILYKACAFLLIITLQVCSSALWWRELTCLVINSPPILPRLLQLLLQVPIKVYPICIINCCPNIFCNNVSMSNVINDTMVYCRNGFFFYLQQTGKTRPSWHEARMSACDWVELS